jgi:hypothetical protein
LKLVRLPGKKNLETFYHSIGRLLEGLSATLEEYETVATMIEEQGHTLRGTRPLTKPDDMSVEEWHAFLGDLMSITLDRFEQVGIPGDLVSFYEELARQWRETPKNRHELEPASKLYKTLRESERLAAYRLLREGEERKRKRQST